MTGVTECSKNWKRWRKSKRIFTILDVPMLASFDQLGDLILPGLPNQLLIEKFSR